MLSLEVSPFKNLRDSLKKECPDLKDIYLFSERDLRKQYHVDYMEVSEESLCFNTSKVTLTVILKKILADFPKKR